MPDFDCAVFGSRDDDWQRGVEDGERDIRRVTLERLNARFGMIIPNFDKTVREYDSDQCLPISIGTSSTVPLPVVSSGNKVGLVTSVVVFYVIDTFIVGIEREIGCVRPERPDFDGTVQASGSKRVGVFRVERQVHDVMRVSLKDLFQERLSAWCRGVLARFSSRA